MLGRTSKTTCRRLALVGVPSQMCGDSGNRETGAPVNRSTDMSAPLQITIPHQLGVVEARRRIAEGFDQLMRQSAVTSLARITQTWEGDSLHFHASALGQELRGRVRVNPASVHIEIDLPMLLANMADAIGGRLQRRARLLLEKK